jgi:hypothetical protein
MQDPWQSLFDGFHRDIKKIPHHTIPGMEQTEAFFRVAVGYWNQVKEHVRQSAFANDDDEIRFFKQIKPSFTGLLEYYHHVYFHQLFCPSGDQADISDFEQHERLKIASFRASHDSFIGYYEAGRTDHDAEYFLRRHRPPDPPPYVRVYDMDPEFLTASDWIVTQYIGYARYDEFLGKIDKV